MKIAAYVDAQGEVAKLSDPGVILLFEQSGGTWTVRKTIRFAVRPGTGLAEMHTGLAAAVAELEDCRIVLSKEVRGVVNSILQEMGLRTWQSHGPLFGQLETVARKENERAQQEAAQQRAERRRCRRRRHHLDGTRDADRDDAEPVHPEPVGAPDNGHYRLDLAALLAADPGVNAWDVLIPFLTGTPFRRLDVVCDHLPRWLSRAMRALNMDAEIELPTGSGQTFTATITPKTLVEAS